MQDYMSVIASSSCRIRPWQCIQLLYVSCTVLTDGYLNWPRARNLTNEKNRNVPLLSVCLSVCAIGLIQ